MQASLIVPQPEDASALYRDHGRAIRTWLASQLRDPTVVEDLCQETFVAALRRGLPAEGSPGAYLFGIARNKVRKHLRDRKTTAALPAEAPAAVPGPTEALGAEEQRARVRAAVAGLEPTLREVIRLRYEGGLNYREIADRLGVPHSTVQGRLKRARIALRDALGEGGKR